MDGTVLLVVLLTGFAAQAPPPVVPETAHRELPEPGVGPVRDLPKAVARPAAVERDGHVSVQVNVAPGGLDRLGDAANEPSIAVDPTAPDRLVVGWRQFDSVSSSWRTAGRAWSSDGGRTWTFPGALDSAFRSDPVLAAASDGLVYYYSLTVDSGSGCIRCDMFRSTDGGRSFDAPRAAWGGDKAWVAVDRSGGAGDGRLYAAWSPEGGCTGRLVFTLSADAGESFLEPLELWPDPSWGSLAVGPEGELYVAGNLSLEDLRTFVVARSLDAAWADGAPSFDYSLVDPGGEQLAFGGPNPGGLVGQVWVGVDASGGPDHGTVYLLASVDPPGADPCDVHLLRSTDRGETWGEPQRIHDDDRGAWQWFATLAVAPTGRLDAVWVESLGPAEPNRGELVFTSSSDGGRTWSPAEAVSPPFDSFLGWPRQNKLGDYYHMVADAVGSDLVYAATFTGGQDVYYLRLGDRDCDANGVADGQDLAAGTARDCDGDGLPDACEVAAGAERDADGDGLLDACEPPSPTPRRPEGRRRP